MLNIRKELHITSFIHTVEVNRVFHPFQWTQHTTPELKVLWAWLSHWVLYRHLYLSVHRDTKFSKSEQQPFISTLQNGNTYIRNQGCEELSIPSQLLQKIMRLTASASIKSQSPSLNTNTITSWMMPDILCPPPPPSCARNWTAAANLKTSKKSPWAHSTNSAAFGRTFIPALLWGAAALQRKPGAIIRPPLLASQDVPFPHGQMARPNFGGSRCETPVDFSGSWTTAKVNFLLNTQFPTTELLRRSLSPWYLKYCWYRERPAWTPSKINVFL